MSAAQNGQDAVGARAALLLIDVINDLEFPGGELLLPQALEMGQAIHALKRRAGAAGLPCIYVNDNFGRWRSDFRQLLDHALDPAVRGHPLAALLAPGRDDYFVLKPKHSGFFGTTLDLLLQYLGVRRLILSGLAGNICVSATAVDAYIRGYDVFVPADCTASEQPEQNRQALAQLATAFKVDTRPAAELDLAAMAAD